MIAVLPVSVPRLASLDGNWLLVFGGRPAVRTTLRNLADQILPAWIATGEVGGFLSANAEPGQCGLAQIPLPVQSSHSELLLQTCAFDPRALQILRSALLAQIAHRYIAANRETAGEESNEERRVDQLARLLGTATLALHPYPDAPIDLATLPGADPGVEESDYDFYPTPVLRRPFDLILAAQQGRLRRCIVDFVATIDRLLIGKLAGRISPWVRLLELGGFEQPYDAPGMRSTAFGTVQIYDAHSVEIVIDRFDAAEGAWSVLVNLLAGFASEYSILSVEVN